MFTSQSAYEVRFEWGARAIEAVAQDEGLTIIVDVLSFSTCVDIACSRGAQVLPWRWKDSSAATHANKHGAVLAGSRDTAGPSLSPRSLLDLPGGSKLVLPSPNGSQLSLECRSAIVLAGCLRNAAAVAAYASAQGVPITVIACGERWPDGSLRPAVEDLLGAGAILAALRGAKSPEAQGAAGAFNGCKDRLSELLANCASGIELAERGFSEDVTLAAALDCSDCVPRLAGNAYVAVQEPAARPLHHGDGSP